MAGISYTSAIILGTLLESIMYGIFVSLFIATCCIQWEKFSTGRGLNRFMVSSTVFFGVATTAHLVVSLRRVLRAILHTPPGTPIQIAAGPPFSADSMALLMIFHFQITLEDVIVTYRMYHIYQRNPFVCIIPSITITATFIVGCILTHQLLSPAINPRVLNIFVETSFWLTMFNGLFLMAAISYRLWSVHRQTKRAGLRVNDSIVLRALRVLVESAALWTTFAALNYFIALGGSNATYITLAMSSPAVGIAFCLIIVRLGHILPEPQEDSWNISVCTPSSRTRTSGRVAIEFPKIEVRREAYAGEPEGFHMEILESGKRGYVNSSDDLVPKAFLSPLHSTPT